MGGYSPIPLQTPPSALPAALQTVGGLMSMRDTASQIALRNQQTQQAQEQTKNLKAEAELRNQNLESTKKLQTVLQDPAGRWYRK